MVERPARRIEPGVVDVVGETGEWIGRALYNPQSPIALRILTQNADEPIDGDFFAHRIAQAVALRKDVLKLDAVTNAYRVVHAEGDQLSGLIVDRFGDVIVTEYFSAVMWKFRDAIKSALSEHFPGAKHYWFAEEHAEKQEAFTCTPPRAPDAGIITEHDVKFRVAFGSRHKTGFFCDQRDNRFNLARMCDGKRVLDLCCNTGGFAVYAASVGNASEVVGVDVDADAIELAKRNAALNKAKVQFVQADIFPWLRDAQTNGEQFDVVILDPAKMTRERDEVINALKKYLDMNKLAMSVVKPGGLLLTCSCTGLVDEPTYLDTVRRASFYAERAVQVLACTGAGPDHPWLANVGEGRYLKAVLCRVL